MNTLSLLPALRVPLLAAAALLACSFTASAQNELIPPGSAPAPATAPAPAIQPAAPADKEVSAADLQALYSRNAELLAIQKKTLERLGLLEEAARQIRIRAARN